jgi:hypothetical protein
MGAPWSRIVNSTIKKYIREREINILRNRKLSALLKKKGRISFNWSGTAMDWKIKYKRVPLTPFADGDLLDFARKDRNKTATLDWRGYSVTDSMTKGEFLQNRNTEAIVKLYSNIATDLTDDCEELFGEEFYVDGTTAANVKRMHGLESFAGGTLVTSAGNGAVLPVRTYAGLSTVPGTYGGTWSSGSLPGWPNGKGDTQYDFWSPIIVDYGDTLFSATNTWLANCVEALSFGIVKSKKSKAAKGMLDVIFVTDEMFRQYMSVYRTKERIIIERQANNSPLIAAGFSDVINQDGVDITWEYGIPSGSGYGFNIDMMELRSQQAQVFVPEGPDFDIASKSWRFSVDFYGNTVFNPKFFVKFTNVTNASNLP